MVRHALTEDDVRRIVTLIDGAGMSHRNVARRVGRSQSVVTRAYQRFQATGGFRRRPGQGRGRCTSNREDRAMRHSALQNPSTSAVSIAQDHRETTGRPVSSKTVRRRLKEGGLHCRRPAKVPALTRIHRRERLRFNQDYGAWRYQEWRNVMCSDECRISLESNDDRGRVYRRRGDRGQQRNTKSITAFGGGSVMVWAGIMANRRTELVLVPPPGLTAVRYVNEILRPHVLPLRQQIGNQFKFQQDNARPHTANVTTRYCDENDITVLRHPPCSPDMNPIEHAWDELKRRLRKRGRKPRNRQELYTALVEIWNEMPQEFFRRLIRSMPARCAAVRRARGGNTLY